MHTNEFEVAFSEFLDGKDYDEAEEWLFSLLRKAFLAGWQAAGGAPSTDYKQFEDLKDKDQET